MNCEKCNTLFRVGAGFCSKCGAPAGEIQSETRQKPHLSKKLVAILCSIAALVLIFVVLYIVGSKSFSPEKTVEAFKEAVNKKDVNKISSLIQSTTSDWAFKKTDAHLLIAYLHEHQNDKEQLFKRLDTEAAQFFEEKPSYLFNDEPFTAISLKQTGKKWLFFRNYSLAMAPVEIIIRVNKDNARIFIDGNEVEANTKEDKERSYGPLSIGTHELKVILPGKYIDAEESKEIVLYEVDSNEIYETFDIHASVVNATTFYNDTRLYINGDKTDVILGNTREEIGMLPLDGSVTFKLEKEFPWGIATSDEYVVEDKSLNLDQFVVIPSEKRKELMDMLNENWKQHTEALQTADTSKMTLVPEKYKEKVKREAIKLQGMSEKYIATFTKARYEVDSLKTPVYKEEKNRYELKVEAEYTLLEPQLHNYCLLRDGDYALTTYYMTLYYDETSNEWKIEDLKDGSFFFNENHEIETFNFEK